TLLALITLLADAGFAEESWRLDREEDGIRVYTRSVDDSRYRAFRGVVELETSLPGAVGLLDNTAACEEWLHLCKESHLIKEVDWSERYIYQISDLPFPASTRDAVFQASISQQANGDIHIDLTSYPDFIPETKYVRIRDSHGQYLLQKIGEHTTRLTWTMYIDPGGSLPAFLVNRLLTDIPFKSLEQFRNVVRQDKYQALEFRYDAEGRPVDLLNKSWQNPEIIETGPP
ncbi:MAG: START domain-containing protein, partial [Pseudomonadales bacterium]|nr:START domain-containing protein [Pseudomonadales bacterium]